MSELFSATWRALTERDPWKKCELTTVLTKAWRSGSLAFDPDIELPEISVAGHPDRPELVNPGRAALIHAITHIEFNAINLALDAVCRFRQMPAEYYTDWLSIASEEAKHFNLLNNRLNKLDCNYGDFPAHNGLWDMAMRTAHDPLHRMAIIPRVMEARGIDVTPGMIKRFRRVDDPETVEILELILREEIGHVRAGSRWFNYLCEQRGIDAESTYLDLVHEYMGNGLHCPVHLQARLDAGFSESELQKLAQMCRKA